MSQMRRGQVCLNKKNFLITFYNQIYPSKTNSYFRTCWTYKSWGVLIGVLAFLISVAGLHIGWE